MTPPPPEHAPPPAPLRIAFLLSGAGRTLQNLVDCIVKGSLRVDIRLAVSSSASAIGVARARQHRIPVAILERQHFGSESSYNDQLTKVIDEARVDYVCMGGFLHLWRFPGAYQGRVLNIHPALLPKFSGKGMFGLRVHAAVLAARERETGCTVHFCDHEYDHGPILLQRRIPVLGTDTAETLADRVFAEECAAYPEALRMLSEGRVRWEKGSLVWKTGSGG